MNVLYLGVDWVVGVGERRTKSGEPWGISNLLPIHVFLSIFCFRFYITVKSVGKPVYLLSCVYFRFVHDRYQQISEDGHVVFMHLSAQRFFPFFLMGI